MFSIDAVLNYLAEKRLLEISEWTGESAAVHRFQVDV
jgi:hypothetical protein